MYSILNTSVVYDTNKQLTERALSIRVPSASDSEMSLTA